MPISRIKTDGIQDDAITSAKIGVNVIVADDLAANSVTVSEITNGAVTSAKLDTNIDIAGTFSVADDLFIGSTTSVGNANADDLEITNSSGSGVVGMTFNVNSGSANTGNIYWRSTTSNNNIQIVGDPVSNYLLFATSGVERLRIDANGRIGIGDGSPDAKLDVRETATSSLDIGIFEAAVGGYTGTSLIAANTLGSSNTYNLFKCITDSDADAGGPYTHFLVRGDGNVGIGTTSPTGKLTISEANGANAPTTITAANTYLHLGSGDFGTSNNGKFMIGFGYIDGTANTNSPAYIGFEERSTSGDTYGDLTFHTRSVTTDTAPTERLRIGGVGLVTFNGDKNGVSDAQVNIVNDEANGLYRCLNLYTGVTGNRIMQTFFNGNGQVGSITTNASSTAYNTSSDYRLKENVTTDWDATTRLKQLNPVRFNFISDADTTVDGFLAHEVQSIVPEAITGTHNEVDDEGNPVYQGIDQSKLVPLLVKTIQELEARITALESN